MPSPGINLERHIMENQKQHPQAKGDFSIMLCQIALAGKIISREVNRAGLADILGYSGKNNVHGEEVQKLDEFAHKTIQSVMAQSGQLCVMVSEESKEPIEIPTEYLGKYVLVFDPLDGSSNIDVGVSIGTIFSIYQKISEGEKGNMIDILQKGKKQLCAGYLLYGSSTMFVYSTGNGVNGFTLDPAVGEFFLSHPNLKLPEKGKIYSVNEGNTKYWPKPLQNYLDHLKSLHNEETPYKARYIGSLVADFHRTLLKGGIFIYPADSKNPKGKLRLLYEASPLAFLAEQAGGLATNGQQPILDIQPTELHERTPLFIGSKLCVEEAQQFLSTSN